jgi:pimeloyl-ACP methyl ester carboxylesterase
VVVGHSLGGHIALEAVAKGLEISGLFVFSTPPLRDARDFPAAFHLELVGDVLFRASVTEAEISKVAGLIMPIGVQPPPYYARSIRVTDPDARGVMGAALKRDSLADERATLESIPCPAALVLGELEQIVNIQYVQSLGLSNLWRGSVQFVPGAGHNPQYDNPEAFNAVLSDFLRPLNG